MPEALGRLARRCASLVRYDIFGSVKLCEYRSTRSDTRCSTHRRRIRPYLARAGHYLPYLTQHMPLVVRTQQRVKQTVFILCAIPSKSSPYSSKPCALYLHSFLQKQAALGLDFLLQKREEVRHHLSAQTLSQCRTSPRQLPPDAMTIPDIAMTVPDIAMTVPDIAMPVPDIAMTVPGLA
eukprot:2421204-Rhodomonas_salina.1